MTLTLEQIDQLLVESIEALTEEQLQFLIENRLDFIKSNNRDKISTEHDPESANFSSNKIVDTIAKKADPTTKKNHTEWLVNRYKAGDFKLGDTKAVKKTMNDFEEVSNRLPNKDLKSYKSISDLRDHIATTTMHRKQAETADEDSVAGETELYNSEGVIGSKINSKTASIANYGPSGKVAKTSWCTASAGSNNMYRGYQGGKYVMKFPNGRVLQFHHGSGQMKDEHNGNVDLVNDPAYKPYAEHIKSFIKQTAATENVKGGSGLQSYIGFEPHEFEAKLSEHEHNTAKIQERLDHDKASGNSRAWIPSEIYAPAQGSYRDLTHMAARANITDDQFDRIQHIKEWDNYHDKLNNNSLLINTAIANNKFAKPEHLDKLADKYKNEDLDSTNVQLDKNIAKNENTSDETLHKLVGKVADLGKATYYGKNLRADLIHHSPNMKEEHFNRLNLERDEMADAIKHSPSKHIPQHVYDYFRGSPAVLARSKHLPNNISEHVAENASQLDANDAHSFVENQNTPLPHIHKALEKRADRFISTNFNIRNVIDRPDATPEDVNKMVEGFNAGYITGRSGDTWAASNRLSRENIHSLIRGPKMPELMSQYSRGIISNPKLRHGEFDEIINNPNFKLDHVSSVLHNQTLRPSNIDTILNKFGSQAHSRIAESDNKAIQPHHITQVLKEPSNDAFVRTNALMHHANTLEHFKDSVSNPRLHGAISASTNAPPSVLHSLAASPHEFVRQNVAENPNTRKEDTLKILSTDSNESIAETAKKRLK